MLGDRRPVSYFIRCGIIFLNDTGVMLVIFLPKVFALVTEQREAKVKVGIARENKAGDTRDPIYGEEGLKVGSGATYAMSATFPDPTNHTPPPPVYNTQDPATGEFAATGPTRFNTNKGTQGTAGPRDPRSAAPNLPPIKVPAGAQSASAGGSSRSRSNGTSDPSSQPVGAAGSLAQLISSQKEDSRGSQESVTSLSPRRP